MATLGDLNPYVLSLIACFCSAREFLNLLRTNKKWRAATLMAAVNSNCRSRLAITTAYLEKGNWALTPLILTRLIPSLKYNNGICGTNIIGTLKLITQQPNRLRSLRLDTQGLNAMTLLPIRECITGLTELTLDNNQLAPKSGGRNKTQPPAHIYFRDALSTLNTQLLRLSLASTGLNSQFAPSLHCILMHTPSLTSLNLSRNKLGPQACRAISSIFRTITSLTELDFSNNHIGENGCYWLSNHISSLTALRVLLLDRCQLHNKGALIIAGEFRKLTTLESLGMSYNQLDCGSICTIGEKLTRLQSLIHFDISGNFVAREGGAGLGRNLRWMSAMKHLNMADSNVDTLAMTTILASLPYTPFIATLDLSNNKLGDEGVGALARCFRSLPLLRDLNLSDNGIGENGGRSLARRSVTCHILRKLDLSSNPIGFLAVLSLIHKLKSKRVFLLDLKLVYLDDDFDSDIVASLCDHITFNMGVPAMARQTTQYTNGRIHKLTNIQAGNFIVVLTPPAWTAA